MNPIVALGLVVIAGVVVYVLWTRTADETKTGEFVLLKGSHPGKVEKSLSLGLPRSFNQPEGLIFSYAAWILVKDFQAGYGSPRRIFSKNNAPGVYLDGTSNTILVNLTTFDGIETMVVPNIPAMKWIHFALVVDQDAADVYINGTLREHRSMSRLPKQNEDSIDIGPGWDGVLARLSYWPRAITPTEVDILSKQPAPDDLIGKPATPQYFDLSWYVGRFYSA
jgi:hypothetical protein